MADVGDAHSSPLIRRTPEPRRTSDGSLEGEVIAVDRFGNAVTNCVGLHEGKIEVAGIVLPIVRTYGDVAPGVVVALVGSSGLIEIAERNGNAARRLGLRPGAVVVVRR